jgi:putative membrane protein
MTATGGTSNRPTGQKEIVLLRKEKYLLLLAVIYFVLLVWSGIRPKDYFTWSLEVIPGLVGCIVLVLTYRKFRFTDLMYTLILIHCAILFVGGHYTYAEVPLFTWLGNLFGWTRNNYDKLGHFAQGFVPTMIARELLLRLKIVNSRAWTGFFVVCIALALSAGYELIEWWTALLTGESAEAFLGTQGYVWDTQSDMLWALIGSVSGILFLSRYHDAAIGWIERNCDNGRA